MTGSNVLLTIISIITAPIFTFIWNRYLRPWWYRKKYKYIIKKNNSYILIVATKDRLDSVESKITKQMHSSLKELRGLPIIKLALPVNCTIGTPTYLMNQLISIRKNASGIGRFVVHLFYAGPVALPAWIGGFFYNQDSVYIYQQRDSETYECWGALKIPGLIKT
ncbi:MAG: hypothetical protein FWH40_02600 [Coriobacteriia bacterium]|nr:hypothetical protein [Coriobacteriia bacterium]